MGTAFVVRVFIGTHVPRFRMKMNEFYDFIGLDMSEYLMQ